MPYVIAYTRPDYIAYAVADLDHARAAVLTALGDADAITGPEDPLCGDVHDMRDEGGTIGPLPDGYVINVVATSWSELFENSISAAGGVAHELAEALLDEYNASRWPAASA